MTFTNETLSLEDLPRYEEAETIPVERKYLKVIWWNDVVLILFFAGINLLFFFVNDFKDFKWIAFFATLLFLIILFILQIKAFERRSWVVRNHDIIYRHGLLSVITTVIPFNRIQHVSVQEGVFSRIYGLASLKVFTAGGSSSDLRISGLKKENAHQIKEMILEKIKG